MELDMAAGRERVCIELDSCWIERARELVQVVEPVRIHAHRQETDKGLGTAVELEQGMVVEPARGPDMEYAARWVEALAFVALTFVA